MIIYFATGPVYEHNIQLTKMGANNRLSSYFYVKKYNTKGMESYAERGIFPAPRKKGKKSHSTFRRRIQK